MMILEMFFCEYDNQHAQTMQRSRQLSGLDRDFAKPLQTNAVSLPPDRLTHGHVPGRGVTVPGAR
jgi:hypothetical protein